MKKLAKYFIASVLAGFTVVYLTASATAQLQNDWPASKLVASVSLAPAA